MPTKAEIRNKALKRVRALEPGQTASADDVADVEEAYDELYAFLVTKGAVTWDSDDDVPDNATYAVVTLLASNISMDYSLSPQERADLKVEAFGIPNVSMGQMGELIDLARPDYVPHEHEGTYY